MKKLLSIIALAILVSSCSKEELNSVNIISTVNVDPKVNVLLDQRYYGTSLQILPIITISSNKKLYSFVVEQKLLDANSNTIEVKKSTFRFFNGASNLGNIYAPVFNLIAPSTPKKNYTVIVNVKNIWLEDDKQVVDQKILDKEFQYKFSISQ